MHNMTINEVNKVSGCGVMEVVVAAAIAYVGAAYQVGKDMAQRDNFQCHADNIEPIE